MAQDEPPSVETFDTASATVKQKGVWERFFHTCTVARLPYGFLAAYIALTMAEGYILISIPQVNGNFFAGDVSVESVLAFIGLDLLSLVVTQGMLFLNHVIRYRTNRNLRNVLWEKILKLKPAYFDSVTASTLISRITVDADSLNAFVLDVVIEGATQIYYLAITVAAMSAVSIQAGLLLLAFVPLTLLISFVIGRLNLKFQNAAKFRLANLSEYLSELVSALPLLKAFNMQANERRRGERVINEYYKTSKHLIFLDVGGSIVGSVVGILPEVVIILMGAKMLEAAELDAAGWYAFYIYAGTFLAFFTTLGSVWTQSKSIQGQLNKVTDILYEDEEGVEPYVKEIVADGDIQFDHVSFAYDGTPVLEDVSLTIPGRKVTALVGYSGAGKTTVTKLIERIYEPDAGRILCEGETIGETNVRAWRESIAYVMQDTPLLSGSIRDNLLYGIHREVTEEELAEAVRRANLDAFIAQTPEGLDREVGLFGSELSGGQRQKVALAGAILSGAKLLILDEPTASLDISSTAEIIRTILSLKGERTVVLVTHDAEAVKAADHVIVAEGGSVYIEGNQAELSARSPFFQSLMEGGEAA